MKLYYVLNIIINYSPWCTTTCRYGISIPFSSKQSLIFSSSRHLAGQYSSFFTQALAPSTTELSPRWSTKILISWSCRTLSSARSISSSRNAVLDQFPCSSMPSIILTTYVLHEPNSPHRVPNPDNCNQNRPSCVDVGREPQQHSFSTRSGVRIWTRILSAFKVSCRYVTVL